ncbi:MAG: nucleotidyltransferase domain-containing protein [Treponema sp.]|nr:nucleotidyltransferase domain-containing protein [Treponema sp.]
MTNYDVRFIYAHPKDWYLNILPKQDVIRWVIHTANIYGEKFFLIQMRKTNNRF